MNATAATIDSSPNPATRPLRVWPITLLLAGFFAFVVANHTMELAMFPRFMSRTIATGILLLLFTAWWLTRRSIPRRDRWLALAVFVAAAVVAGLLAHLSLGMFGLFMSSIPVVFAAWVAWLWIARNKSSDFIRFGLLAVIIVAVGFFDLLRMNGTWNNQFPRYHWRWTPTPEDLLAASEKNRPAPKTDVAADASLSTPRSGDWFEFRGPNRDGLIRDVRLVTDWKARPPREIWRKKIGPAWSSLIVVNRQVITQDQLEEMERVVCLNAETGEREWMHQDKARFYEGLSGAGPRGTPTFADNRIYTLGATGLLNCLDAATGKKRWSHDLVAENGAAVPLWGLSASPLVRDGLVVIYAGGPGDKDLVAYRADSGELAWARPTGGDGYSSPQLSTIDGVRQIVMQSDSAVGGFRVAGGELLWERPNGPGMTLPMLQPYPVDDRRFIVTSGQGLALIEVQRKGDEWTTNDVWISNDLEPSFSGFVVHDKHIYGLGDGILRCLDLETGKRVWKKGRYGAGQVMFVPDQGLLVVLGETGDVTLVAANPQRHEELATFHAIDGKTWNHPVIAHGRLYVRNDEEIACYELPAND